MPTVVTTDNFTQQPGVLPSARVERPSADAFSIAGSQLRAAAEAQDRASRNAEAMVLDSAQTANRLRVREALSGASKEATRLAFDPKEGYTSIRGRDALERESGKPLDQEYTEKLQTALGAIRGGLSNDAQRMAFDEQASNLALSFQRDIMQHQGREAQAWSQSVNVGVIDNRINEIGFKYLDPNAVQSAVADIRSAAYSLARQQGKSDEEAQAASRKAESSAHSTAVAAALQNNQLGYAEAYLNRYAKDMDADDALRAQGVLTKQLDAAAATNAVQSVFASASSEISPSGFDRLMNITRNSESGGRQAAADGSITRNTNANGTSDYGAYQINENTAREAAKLAGVEWDEALYKSASPDGEAYNAKLARAYMAQQIKTFGGNVAQAVAAYNAGPGRVQEAIDLAKRESAASGQPRNWLSYMPEAVQRRVAKDMRAFSTGGGAGTPPSLPEMQARVRALVGEGSPEKLSAALELTAKQYGAQMAAIKQRDDNAVATALQNILQNGGGYSDLPADIRANIPPERVGTVIDFAAKIARGADATTDWGAYYELKRDPRLLAQTNLMALRDKLSDTEFKDLVNEQRGLTTGGESHASTLRSDDARIKQYLSDVGITEKTTGYDARVGRVWAAYTQQVRTQEAQLGRKLNPPEREQALAKLMVNVQLPGWLSNSDMPFAALLPDEDFVVPSPAREKIVDYLRRVGKPPTEANINTLYSQFIQGSK